MYKQRTPSVPECNPHTNRCSLTTTNMNATDDKDKGLSQTNPDPSLGLHRYTENKIGDVPVETNSLKLHRVVPSKEAIMLLKQLITITSSGKNAASLYAPISALLTRASIDLTPGKEEKVLVFVENSTSVFRVNPKDSTDKPGLVAFLADRNTALKITERDLTRRGSLPILVPSTHFLLSVVAVRVKSDPTDQCLRYLVVLFRHRPENSVVHGLIVNGDYFGLAAQRLHRQELWPEVYWSDKGQIDKLYDYLSIIIKETRRDFPLEVPKLVSAVDTGSHTTCIYSAHILGENFFLSPIFTGRGNSSRKAFVTIAHKEGSNDDKRIFKYS